MPTRRGGETAEEREESNKRDLQRKIENAEAADADVDARIKGSIRDFGA